MCIRDRLGSAFELEAEAAVAQGPGLDLDETCDPASGAEAKLSLLGDYKVIERQLTAKLEEELGGWFPSQNGAILVVDEAIQVSEQWISVIREVRSEYEQAGVPESLWKVSSSGAENKNAAYEPSWTELAALFNAEAGANQNVADALLAKVSSY